MRNTFGGTCYRCNQYVKPFAGHFEKISSDNGKPTNVYKRWRVQHASCAIEFREATKGE